MRRRGRLGLALGGGGTPIFAPDMFNPPDWSVANLGTVSNVRVTITRLPFDGGSVILNIEYSVDSGLWLSSGRSTTGTFDIGGLVTGVMIGVRIRAVNAVGAGAASGTKTVTPT